MSEQNKNCIWCGKPITKAGITFHGFLFCRFECIFESKSLLEDTDKRNTEIDILKNLFEACKNIKVPIFFIFDFLEYQEERNWEINGVKIRNRIGAFVRYAKARKTRLLAQGSWHGENINDWDLTPAVFKGFFEPSSPKNKAYIERLTRLLVNGEQMTKQEKKDMEQMKMKEALEDEIYYKQETCGISPFLEEYKDEIDQIREYYDGEIEKQNN